MGQLMSSLYFIFEYAVNAVLFWRRSELQYLLEDIGLDENKWTKILRDVSGVNDLSQLKAITQKREEIRKLIERAEDYEISGLYELFDIPQDVEKPITEPEKELWVKLKELGLDEHHWFNILKTKFTVSNMVSIKHIGLDCLNELKHVCQSRNERAQLQKLFGTDNDNPSFVLHFVKMQNRIRSVVECIKQIKSLISNGKTRFCESVQAKEQSLREILHITAENWIRPNTSLEMVLSDLSKLNCYSEADITSQDLSPSHLILSASCGICLKGVLYTGNGNYVFPANYPVLNVPSRVVLNGSNLSDTETIINGKVDHVKSFIKHADTYGCVSEYLHLPSSNGNESTVKMKKVPIASFTFRRDELRLSDSAFEHLTKIGALIDVDEIRVIECCKEFLNIYGSHIFQGPFHFGGIHWISAENTQADSGRDVRAMHLELISAIENAPLGRFCLNSVYDASKLRAKNTSKYRRQDSKYVVLKATTSGGPKVFSHFPTWKLGMSADISSWIVIDRETAFTVAVWEILNENYTSLQNASKISCYLFKAWADMTKEKHVYSISSELHALITDAHTLLTSSEVIDASYRQDIFLEELLEVKRKVIKYTRSIRAWSDIFIGSKEFDILNFLKLLVKYPKRNTLRMICNIINDNDILNQPCVSSERLNDYYKWRKLLEQDLLEQNVINNSISEFSDLAFLLEQAILDIEEQSLHASPRVAAYLSKAVIRLVTVFEGQMRFFDAKLLFALTAPLDFNEAIGFLNTKLTVQDVTNLEIMCKNKFSTYVELQDNQQKSVFILATFLEMILLCGSCSNLKHQLQKLNLYSDLPGEARNEIENLKYENPENFRNFVLNLHKFYGHPSSYDQDLSLHNSLYNAMHYDRETYGSRTSIHSIHEVKPQCSDIIEVIKLKEYFPKKLTRQKALIVQKNIISRDELQNPEKIPWYMLQSLMMCNYEGRSFQQSEEVTSFIDDDETLSALLNKPTAVKDVISTTDVHLNPADVLVALFMCADDFLRQVIIEKLTICQFSIPLLLPIIINGSQSCEMLLWATRTIKKQWKTYAGSSYERLMSMHPIPIVSALRIGKLGISKSKMLNAVINDQKHDVFFHYGSNGGTLARNISNGLLEMTWYLPTGRNQDKFPDALAIMNLRGNASHFKGQTAFLSEVSFATIAFIASDIDDKKEAELLESLYMQNGYLILVSEGTPGKHIKKLLLSLQQQFSKSEARSKQLQLIYSSKKNELQVSGEIRSTLKYMLSKGCPGVPKRSIHECSVVAKDIGFYVDEDTEECLNAKEDAEEMSESLKRYIGDSSNPEEKVKLLPLQMIAIKIAERKREQYQLKQIGNMGTEKYIDKVQLDLKVLRAEQKRYCNSFSNLIKIFMKSYSFSPLHRKYFHCWVKILADQCSMNQLQPVREEYSAKWNKLCDAVSTNQNKPSQEIHLLKKELDELQQKLTNLSVGLEHFNREIAQIYEMVLYFNLSPSSYSVQQFPIVAADMLMEGHPLELMDGDASHVPTTWIKDVMSCLRDKIGNKRLFVLSVLGVQSTGKSTMLNVMFGLQFAVSAGRCTKGVFAQLVQLQPDLQQSTNCDYILVVDTEGLRTVELTSIEHTNRDNEIATLVIGLGDATIINIMGENPSDMQDTLQIVVHALMKMENVKMKPSCLFVHQNVADITASDKNTVQKRKMTEMLDEITKIAAKEENCSEKFRVFSDVINFQENKHVIYISSLWQGDPPMAPSNPGYSSCILQVRKKVIDLMQNCDCQTISNFHHKLTDLWRAILSENFVFSFRNTLEIQAFNALETEYVEHSRTLRRNAMTCVNVLRSECNKLTPSLLEVNSEKILNTHLTTLKEGIETFRNKMNDYFAYKPKAREWKGRTEKRMDELCGDLEKFLKGQLMAIKNKIIGRAKIDSDMKMYEKDIQKKAKWLADEFRRSKDTGEEVTEEKLQKEFDDNWEKWIADIPAHEDPVDIWSTLEYTFRECFPSQKDQVVNNILSEQTYVSDLDDTDIKLDPKTVKDHIPFFGTSLNACYDIAKQYIDTIKSDLEKSIKVCKGDGKSFTEQMARDMVDSVSNRLINVKTTEKFKFHDKGRIRTTIHILWSLEKVLIDLQNAYIKETDLKQYMESQKNRLWQMFRDECTIVKISVSASYAVSRDLVSAIKGSLTQNCITGVIDHVRKSQRGTFANKINCHAKLLIDLAEQNDFEAFLKYFKYPFNCMENYIEDSLREICKKENANKETVLQSIYSQKVTELFKIATAAIFRTCKSLDSTCSMSVLWPNLLENIGNGIDIKPEVVFLNNDDIFDMNELHNNLLLELQNSKEKMEKAFNIDILNEIIEPCKQFFTTDLLGCRKLCPFCKAPCDLQVGEKCDYHRTEYHRPTGVAGSIWEDKKKLCVEVCTSYVMTDTRFRNEDTEHKWHPYKDYQGVNDYYKAWKIQPMAAESQLYWKWFMATYNVELAKYYRCKPADVPDGWKKISWETAKDDLINTYNL